MWTVCSCVRASLSSETLHAGAVKGLSPTVSKMFLRAQDMCEQVDGAELSPTELDHLLLLLFSTVGCVRIPSL